MFLSPEWAERMLSWQHSGFNVRSRVRARTKAEAERVGKYMVRSVLAQDRLSFLFLISGPANSDLSSTIRESSRRSGTFPSFS